MSVVHVIDSSLGILQGIPLLESRLPANIGEPTSTPAAATQLTMQIHDGQDEEDHRLWVVWYQKCPNTTEGRQRSSIARLLRTFEESNAQQPTELTGVCAYSRARMCV